MSRNYVVVPLVYESDDGEWIETITTAPPGTSSVLDEIERRALILVSTVPRNAPPKLPEIRAEHYLLQCKFNGTLTEFEFDYLMGRLGL